MGFLEKTAGIIINEWDDNITSSVYKTPFAVFLDLCISLSEATGIIINEWDNHIASFVCKSPFAVFLDLCISLAEH